MMLGAAGREHGEIFLHKTLVGVLVDAVERIHEAIAEGIGVDIEGRVDEMRDIGPEGLISCAQLDRGPERIGLHAHPQIADLVGGEFALAAFRVQLALEGIEGDLAHHRVQHVLDLRGQHGAPLGFVGGARQQGPERQHFAKHRCGFSQRQRRGRHQRAIGRRQHLMHAVAELVGERHHVARLALVIHQHIGMGRGHGGMCESARRLAGANGGVDPALVEEAARNVSHFRGEIAIGAEHRVARLNPSVGFGGHIGEWRVAVPMVQLLHAEPLGFQLVIAVRQPRMRRLHGGDQRIDHFALDAVRQVA